MKGVRLKIVALHAGPVTVAEDQGQVNADGTLERRLSKSVGKLAVVYESLCSQTDRENGLTEMKNQLLVEALRNGNGMLKMTLADMTDADLAQRPVPNANTGLWQLGHLISSEAHILNACACKTLVELPSGFAERYKKTATGENDPAKLGTKDELLGLLDKVRESSADWYATLTPEELDAPAPENIRRIAPSIGHAAHLLAAHAAMHLGQIQVLRRKLGKPVIF